MIFYFQIRESLSPINIPIPTHTPASLSLCFSCSFWSECAQRTNKYWTCDERTENDKNRNTFSWLRTCWFCMVLCDRRRSKIACEFTWPCTHHWLDWGLPKYWLAVTIRRGKVQDPTNVTHRNLCDYWLASSIWDLSLWIIGLIYFVWDPATVKLRLGRFDERFFTWDRLFGKSFDQSLWYCRMETIAFECSFRSFVWELSLTECDSITFVWKFPFSNLRAGMSFGRFCLTMFRVGASVGNFSL